MRSPTSGESDEKPPTLWGAFEWQAIRLEGYVWVFDIANGRFVRKPERRERIVCLGDRLTINVLPPEADLETVKYVTDPERGLVATDGRSFALEVTEFTVMR